MMKAGVLVYDHGIRKMGLILEVINSVVPFRILYEDGTVDIACGHELEVL